MLWKRQRALHKRASPVSVRKEESETLLLEKGKRLNILLFPYRKDQNKGVHKGSQGRIVIYLPPATVAAGR